MCVYQIPVKFDGNFGAYVITEKDLRIWVHTILKGIFFFTLINCINVFIFFSCLRKLLICFSQSFILYYLNISFTK